jgi:hypothetical protein
MAGRKCQNSSQHVWCRKKVSPTALWELINFHICPQMECAPFNFNFNFQFLRVWGTALKSRPGTFQQYVFRGKADFFPIFILVQALSHYTWTVVWWTSNNPVRISAPSVSSTAQWFILFFRTSMCRENNLTNVHVTFYIPNGRNVSAGWTVVTPWCPQRAYVCGE